MNIVVLDGYTMNPGDLDWGTLMSLGECTIYDRTPVSQTVARADDADIVLTNKTVLDAETLAALPKLKYIGVLATGYNVVNLPAAHKQDIIVTNVPAYSTDSVAQTTFALLLELCHHVGEHSRGVHNGRWATAEDFCYWDFPLIELTGKTIGIIGFGQIGRAVAQRAAAFGMKVLAANRSPIESCPAGVEQADIDAIFARSDVVSLHCPLTEQTRGLVNTERLATMKPTAFLINTARGPVVDEAALAAALNADQIAGAAVDVLSAEPPTADNPLLRAKNCIITPHIAWATQAARSRLMTTAVENVRAFLAGKPVNVVS